MILWTVAVGCLAAAGPSLARVSAGAARKAAIKILLGNPYGNTPAQVRRTLVSQTLGPDAHCHTRKAAWTFHVVVPKSESTPDGIDGYLVLDAASGRLLCAGLPFLD